MSDKPHADPREFDRMGQKWWLCRTTHPYRYVEMPGFFDTVIHNQIAVDDRIEIIALGDVPATHATLVVDGIGNDAEGRVRVTPLVEYRRTANGD